MRQLKITKQITQRTDRSINRYFQEICKYPMVSAEEEVELSVKIRNGDTSALEKLVTANLRFVISVAKQYQNQGLSFSDLINEGNIGLVKAAQRFDETRGFKFISYAVWWIRQSIIQAIAEQTRIVRLPLNRLSSIKKISKAMLSLEQEFEREPTDDEIAEHLDISDDEVKVANENKKHQLSFDKPLIFDGGDELNLYDLVQTNDIPSPDSRIVHDSIKINVKRVLNKLTEREASILTMSYGLFNTPQYTLTDIAIKHDMSSERVRQIRSNILTKLKSMLKGKHSFIDF